jgi:hypothetical protein
MAPARLAARSPAVASARGPAAARAPPSVALMTATPASSSPARRSQQMSLEKVTYSYFGPVADKVVIDTGQSDRFRVLAQVAPPRPDRRIEVEIQAAGVGLSYHALQPEKRRHTHTSRDRMQTGRRIKHEIARGQLDFVGTVDVLQAANLKSLQKSNSTRSKMSWEMPIYQAFLHRHLRVDQSVLGGFISENNSSTVCCATSRMRSVLSIPAMLTPFTTALISSRKSVSNRKGSGELLATRAIKPGDQDLAGDHASVQFTHHALPNNCAARNKGAAKYAR